MSMRLEMLQVARLAPNLLLEARDLVAQFIASQFNDDGGFADRAGNSDLYYTVFGLEGLLALREPIDAARVAAFLAEFEDGEDLDFVHLGCLARCWSAVGNAVRLGDGSNVGETLGLSRQAAELIVARVEQYRADDGGYSQSIGDSHGTVYGCFLALATYQDLQLELPDAGRMIACIESQRADDGGFANGHDFPLGTLPTTAAAVTALRVLGAPLDKQIGDWMLTQCHESGGFLAMPDAPMPDLLSTAVALHALSGMHVSFEPVKERCLDYIDTLWVNKGGFYGNWSEDEIDIEYTYYGLLALGHLSL